MYTYRCIDIDIDIDIDICMYIYTHTHRTCTYLAFGASDQHRE